MASRQPDQLCFYKECRGTDTSGQLGRDGMGDFSEFIEELRVELTRKEYIDIEGIVTWV